MKNRKFDDGVEMLCARSELTFKYVINVQRSLFNVNHRYVKLMWHASTFTLSRTEPKFHTILHPQTFTANLMVL